MGLSTQDNHPEKLHSGDWLISYGGAFACFALSVQEWLARNFVTVMPYLLYSPDLALYDLFLFSKLKLVCKRIFDVVIKEHRSYICVPSNERINGLAVLEHETYFEGDSME